ncbi:hypothetical protein MTP99_013869 [Tenebrio molitor]|jgi:hypothetical protein|nr:hypothetical protein MTP99_013869 [Tenebrio molitor]
MNAVNIVFSGARPSSPGAAGCQGTQHRRYASCLSSSDTKINSGLSFLADPPPISRGMLTLNSDLEGALSAFPRSSSGTVEKIGNRRAVGVRQRCTKRCRDGSRIDLGRTGHAYWPHAAGRGLLPSDLRTPLTNSAAP